MSSINNSVLSVEKLLCLKNLAIPDYQRPYKWAQKNISQLFQDLQTHQDKPAQHYRLGTVVFHLRDTKSTQHLDIVDGQQRTLTLFLAIKAVIETRQNNLDRQDLKNTLENLRSSVDAFMTRQRFFSDISKHNLHKNYMEAKRIVSRSEFTEAHIDFLLNKCQVVAFELEDISEAFQFFDSQNARGRDLEPHDLLKAFHLREFPEHESKLKSASVAHWESLNSNELSRLFAIYLSRIRCWAEGKSARYFSKKDVGLFKGVNLDNISHFPYVASLKITHHYVDDYNHQYHRKIDGKKMAFPFHLDQTVINGRRFFEMAQHYQQQVMVIIADEQKHTNDKQSVIINGIELGNLASDVMRTLNSYSKRYRTGDKYVRDMFDCALIFYMDKFGGELLSSAIEKIFIWAYRCRIRQHAVYLATMDNHVLTQNLFQSIKDATMPRDVLRVPLSTINHKDNKNNKKGEAVNDPLVILFQRMGYYEGNTLL